MQQAAFRRSRARPAFYIAHLQNVPPGAARGMDRAAWIDGESTWFAHTQPCGIILHSQRKGRAMSGASVDKGFKGMLARIFSDGVVEPEERAELRAKLKDGSITADQARATMIEFLRTTMKHVMADGKVTDRERDKLRTMLAELALPDDCVPDEVKRAVA